MVPASASPGVRSHARMCMCTCSVYEPERLLQPARAHSECLEWRDSLSICLPDDSACLTAGAEEEARRAKAELQAGNHKWLPHPAFLEESVLASFTENQRLSLQCREFRLDCTSELLLRDHAGLARDAFVSLGSAPDCRVLGIVLARHAAGAGDRKRWSPLSSGWLGNSAQEVEVGDHGLYSIIGRRKLLGQR